MNANELNRWIENSPYTEQEEVIVLLRQQQAEVLAGKIMIKGYSKTIDEQQAEIEALKSAKIRAYNNGVEDGRKPDTKNQPVAWMFQGAFDISTYVSFEKPNPDIYPNPTPLYIHPVKELTREDRLKLIGTLKWAEDLLREAKHDEAVSDAQDCLMILRKAQEK